MKNNEKVEFPDFRRALTALINSYSKENGSDTPDFILAEYLIGCLFDEATRMREDWYQNDPTRTNFNA